MSDQINGTYALVSLGCTKNLVDSERILTQLRAEGYAFAADYQEADLVAAIVKKLPEWKFKEEGKPTKDAFVAKTYGSTFPGIKIKQMFLTYPDLAGIGITTGENMRKRGKGSGGKLSAAARED